MTSDQNVGKLFKVIPYASIEQGLAVKDIVRWKKGYRGLNTEEIIPLPPGSIVMWLETVQTETSTEFIKILYISEILYIEPHFLEEIKK